MREQALAGRVGHLRQLGINTKLSLGLLVLVLLVGAAGIYAAIGLQRASTIEANAFRAAQTAVAVTQVGRTVTDLEAAWMRARLDGAARPVSGVDSSVDPPGSGRCAPLGRW
jgi:hypothetical protein